jgi:hypothetical protein
MDRGFPLTPAEFSAALEGRLDRLEKRDGAA